MTDMSELFQSFCNMMDNLPPAAAKKAAAGECRMLEEDRVMGREESVGEVASVLAFCRFLASAGNGEPGMMPGVPLGHWFRYAKITDKLVRAGELPATVKESNGGMLGKILSWAVK